MCALQNVSLCNVSPGRPCSCPRAQAAGLDQYVADLSIIFTIDWALDRVRTVCNVLRCDCHCVSREYLTGKEYLAV
jgi:hypothetical protein